MPSFQSCCSVKHHHLSLQDSPHKWWMGRCTQHRTKLNTVFTLRPRPECDTQSVTNPETCGTLTDLVQPRILNSCCNICTEIFLYYISRGEYMMYSTLKMYYGNQSTLLHLILYGFIQWNRLQYSFIVSNEWSLHCMHVGRFVDESCWPCCHNNSSIVSNVPDTVCMPLGWLVDKYCGPCCYIVDCVQCL